jgi:hypothetical protein
MAWLEGLLDSFDPNNPRGMQMAGLLGGLGAMGAGLSAAGAPRPVGQPGPSMADAFGAYGQGQQRAVMGAYQNAQMQRQQQRQALLAEAQSNKPDEQISPPARAMRAALSTLPESVRALADPDQLPQLTVQRETQRQRPMTAAELQAAGYRPGTVAYTSDWTGTANVAQQPDTMSPERYQQGLGLAAAGRAPQTTWRTIPGPDGQPIAQISSLGEYRSLRTPSDGFTLAPGQQRFGPDGRPIASVPEKETPFTLAPGQHRFGPDGRPMAALPEKEAPFTLAPGQTRYGPDGRPVAAEPEKPTPFTLAPGQTRYGTDGKPVASGGADPKQPMATADALRGEYTKLTADFRTVQDAYNKIQMAGQTGQGDMALLYGYMKILDPGSVVRESEFAMAAKTGSLGEQMQGLVTKVLNGERLPESVRKGFISEAKNVYQAQARSYMQAGDTYRGLAMRLGADPQNVVLPFQTPGVGGGAGAPAAPSDPLGILR